MHILAAVAEFERSVGDGILRSGLGITVFLGCFGEAVASCILLSAQSLTFMTAGNLVFNRKLNEHCPDSLQR
jgi:hypothetical protein